VRVLDGIRVFGPDDGQFIENPRSTSRELVTAAETGGRWRFGEVRAVAEPSVSTHVHPGEAEALVILEGEIELHGSTGIAHLAPGDVVVIPPDMEHGLRTPAGGRWFAIWPIADRVSGPRYEG
jgi:mannose-6-phosphate isomerase-like protein (cupin superfamily)